MNVRSFAVTACAAALLVVMAGCGNFFVGDDAADHVTVTPASKLLAVSETQQYKASAVTVGGNSTDVTSSATWTSSDTAIATVSTSGLVTAVSAGSGNDTTLTISAESGGETGTAQLVVAADTLDDISITPNDPIIARGATQQMTATGNLANGTSVNLTNAVTWTSSDNNVATVSSTGLVTAQATAVTTTATIKASISTTGSTITQSVTVTVQ